MYLSIWPRTRPHRSPNFAKPNDTVKVLRGVWVPIPNDSAMAIRGKWAHWHPLRAADAPIVAPVAAQTPAPLTVAVDAASRAPLKACRINAVIDERLHCTPYVMVMIVAYVA